MGAEESRNGNYGLMGASAVVYNMKRQVQHARPWSLLHQCSLDQWKSGHAGMQNVGVHIKGVTCLFSFLHQFSSRS